MHATIQGVEVNLPPLALAKLVILHYIRDPLRNVLRVMFPQAFRPEIPYAPPNEDQRKFYDSLHVERKNPERFYKSGTFHEKARMARGAASKPTPQGPSLGHGTEVAHPDGTFDRVARTGQWDEVQAAQDPAAPELEKMPEGGQA